MRTEEVIEIHAVVRELLAAESDDARLAFTRSMIEWASSDASDAADPLKMAALRAMARHRTGQPTVARLTNVRDSVHNELAELCGRVSPPSKSEGGSKESGASRASGKKAR